MEARELLQKAVLDCDLPMLRTIFRITSSNSKLRKLLDAPDFDEYTALQRACMYGNAELVSLLLDIGVDIESRGKDNWTALHVTVGYTNGDSRILKILLNSFADVLARDSHGCLPIDLARDFHTRKTLQQHMEKRGASELAEMYSKIEVSTPCHRLGEPKSDPEVRRRKSSKTNAESKKWRYSDCIETDTDDSFDEDEEITFGMHKTDRKIENSTRFWRSNLAVWEKSDPAKTCIKRHCQVAESSISLISDASMTKCRDSGVYCDGEDELDTLAASFQDGKSCLSRWQPYDDLSSFSP